jgi:adsorption protein B
LESLHVFFSVFGGILVCLSFVSSLDELFIDLVYFLRVLAAKGRYRPEYTEAFLSSHPEKPIAILVPAWQESDVIRRMVKNAVRAYRYNSYEIFVGTYPNDLNTQREVDQVVGLFPHVHKVVVGNPGPTCKADCLNGIYSAILEFEHRCDVRFEVFVQHDSEDMVHPLELKVFNLLIPESDMVQLPVYSGNVPWNFWTGGHYIGEFCEQHVKLMPVRDLLTGSVPGAGVGCGFSRRALEAMALCSDGLPFNTDSLTEDYDLALRLSLNGFKTRFVAPVAVCSETERAGSRLIQKHRRETICTRGLFPPDQKTAVKQKSRWILGICLQSWETMGWHGGFWQRYMLFRDRKGMVTSLTGFLGYGWSAWTLLEHPRIPSFTELICAPLMVLAGWRLLVRAACVYSRNGWREAFLSLPRTVFGNWINFNATRRALGKWLDWKMHGKALTWEKTAHEFPEAREIDLVRPKLGDVLMGQQRLRLDQLKTALDHQQHDPRPIGEILVELGFVEDHHVHQALSAQAPRTASGD